MASDPTSISDCLKQGVLASIVKKARLIAALEKEFEAYLPKSVWAHCTIMNLRHETLVIAVDSAAWSMRIRQLTPGILENCAKITGLDGMREIKKIQCLVRMPCEAK